VSKKPTKSGIFWHISLYIAGWFTYDEVANEAANALETWRAASYWEKYKE
jgi:hypothetical protein